MPIQIEVYAHYGSECMPTMGPSVYLFKSECMDTTNLNVCHCKTKCKLIQIQVYGH